MATPQGRKFRIDSPHERIAECRRHLLTHSEPGSCSSHGAISPVLQERRHFIVSQSLPDTSNNGSGANGTVDRLRWHAERAEVGNGQTEAPPVSHTNFRSRQISVHRTAGEIFASNETFASGGGKRGERDWCLNLAVGTSPEVGFGRTAVLRWFVHQRQGRAVDRDRGTPRGATPPTPPGIRVRTTAVRSS